MDKEDNKFCPLEAFGVSKNENIWIFGYGSLMWNPEFPFVQSALGHLCGYHRRFCLYSYSYRGTEETPGLVLGLDRGGSCRGVLFEIEASKIEEALSCLWQREMHPSDVYVARKVPVLLRGDIHQKIEAHTFVINRKNSDYYPDPCREKAADLISKAEGHRGTNLAYLENTVKHLRDLGIQDQQLEDLLNRVQKRLS